MVIINTEQADRPNPFVRAPIGTPEPIRPAFDLRLLEGGYYLDGEVPGSTKDSIAVEVSGFQTLVISGTLRRAYPGPPPDFKPDSRVNAEEYYSVPMHVLLDRMLLEQTSARHEEAEGTCFANASRAPAGNPAGEAAPSLHVQARRGGQGAFKGQPAAGVRNNGSGQGTQQRANQRGDRNQQGGGNVRGRSKQRDGNPQDGCAQQGYGNRGRERRWGQTRGRGEGIQRRETISRREEIQRMSIKGEEDDDEPRQHEPQWKLAEREVGFFSRSFILDKPIEWNATEVRYKDGILTIWLPLGPMPDDPIRLSVSRD